MHYAQVYNLLPGDKIVVPLFETGISMHHAIYLGFDDAGYEWVTENHKFKDVQIVSAAEFFNTNKRINRIEKFTGNAAQRMQVVQQAWMLAGKPYDLINYNCEHFANEVLYGKAESMQVNNVFRFLAFAGGIWLLSEIFD
ncbi:MAG TPA: lecithin retinol acyltransferase family protein [Parafilimonas sp.]|nr:lecithin retinol acyltransferase family protein [Parafilimonas sp.]